MMSRLLCSVFGHQPHEFSYESGRGIVSTVSYTECVRCGARKDLENRGWIHDHE